MREKFTSGGTNGFKLDFENYKIPDGNNVYGIILEKSKLEIAKKFHSIGWSIRKSSTTDFEIEGKWAEINLIGENEILINCMIDENHFEEFIQILKEFNFKFSIELYDENEKLSRLVQSSKTKEN